MTAPRPAVDPVMQAWIDEQKKNFGPNSMDAAVRVMRGHARIIRERTQTKQGSAA